MKRFKSRRHLQRFVCIHDPIAKLFHIPRHEISSGHHRELRSVAMNLWAKIAEHDRRNRPVQWPALVAVRITMPSRFCLVTPRSRTELGISASTLRMH